MEGDGEPPLVAAMEVEAETMPCAGASPPASSNSSFPTSDSIFSSRRLCLKNSIQTNFGDDYVFQIASW
ncbi:hypothetical protein PR202_ga03516 [Eleusine coracana subsp. coracana]|uniref:Uncharacterized protein n=1 Tax=Eleusine coracana subsp. coracana TaxID=191504 RepID=A0AAV5BP67_ELECO|nr:hypothetical protein PR202_ga03516 [Eleusine coracana subsp. coracana]